MAQRPSDTILVAIRITLRIRESKVWNPDPPDYSKNCKRICVMPCLAEVFAIWVLLIVKYKHVRDLFESVDVPARRVFPRRRRRRSHVSVVGLERERSRFCTGSSSRTACWVRQFDCFVPGNCRSTTNTATPNHAYRLFKPWCTASIRSNFFAERVINIWNSFPVTVNFSTLKSFRRTIQSVDFSSFLKCS